MGESLFLGLALVVFVVFGAALAWADYSSRHLRPPTTLSGK